MNKKANKPIPFEQAKEPKTYEHQVDKMQFIVTPIYRDDSDKTIHDILLSWIKRDIENR